MFSLSSGLPVFKDWASTLLSLSSAWGKALQSEVLGHAIMNIVCCGPIPAARNEKRKQEPSTRRRLPTPLEG